MTGVPGAPITILVADDSPTQRELLVSMIEAAGGFAVVGVAATGLEAVSKAESLRPDIILMDCMMPKLSGFEATRLIMQRCPTPIVMVSSTPAYDEMEHAFEAVKCGALAFSLKPASPDSLAERAKLIETMRLMAEVKVVGRRDRSRPSRPADRRLRRGSDPVKMIAVAGSTGAPGIIADLLRSIAGSGAAPVLIVQHMAEGFVMGYARWLSDNAGFPVRIAHHGMTPVPGEAYLAGDNFHMGVDQKGRIALADGPPDEGFRPSANHLFHSIARSCGPAAVGVLLTGMGRDGATGLLAMHQAGSVTIAQDEASCVVFGMPRAAIELGAADLVLAPDEIAATIRGLAKRQEGPRDGLR